LLYFAFGGFAGGGSEFEIPVTQIVVANQDELGQSEGFAAGQMLVDSLQSEAMADVLEVSEVQSPVAARAAVDAQTADVALIIPSDFTAAAFEIEGRSSVTLYEDPTLTVGPAVVRDLVRQFMDGFSGSKIAVKVTAEQLAERGVAVTEAMMQEVANRYAAYIQRQGEGLEAADPVSYHLQQVSQLEGSPMTEMIMHIMVGMSIFYAFFTAASTAESILREEENGTLERLFTTPVPRAAILGGKYVSVFLTLAVQLVVLMIASSLIFGIRWNLGVDLVLAVLAVVVIAAGFGIFFISFFKNQRQAGFAMGAVLTVMGMLGGVMTDLPSSFKPVTLLMPQGWALRTWRAALAGGMSDVWLPWLVTIGIGLACFVGGVYKFGRRFA
jgi:ABC-type Na+ efflux pump permease subunit